MKKNEMVDEIKKVFDTVIRPVLVKTGFGDFTIKPNSNMPKDRLEKTILWLDDLIKNEFKNVKDAYELVPPHWWENYKIFGKEMNELAECKILKQALKEFKAVWNKRPSVLIRTYFD
jgi:hypothetical protein